MTDTVPSQSKLLWRYLAVTAVVTVFLTWADGRLWPSVRAYAEDSLWLLIGLQFLLGTWGFRFWPGRLAAAIVNGALFWQLGAVATTMYADPERRSTVLVVGALLAAWVVLAFVWNRIPDRWKARYPDSKIQRVVYGLMLVAIVGGLVSLMLITVLRELGPAERWGVGGAILAMAGGLGLALWRLDGWPRAVTCWAILSLAWIALMTGLAVTLALGAVTSEGWLLALLPPAIVGAVMAAYWRINRAYKV